MVTDSELANGCVAWRWRRRREEKGYLWHGSLREVLVCGIITTRKPAGPSKIQSKALLYLTCVTFEVLSNCGCWNRTDGGSPKYVRVKNTRACQ